MTNEEAIRAFAEQFDPALPTSRVDRIDGREVYDGWIASRSWQQHEISITALCWGKGHFRAFSEITGTWSDAETAGAVLTKLISFAEGQEWPASITGNVGRSGVRLSAQSYNPLDFIPEDEPFPDQATATSEAPAETTAEPEPPVTGPEPASEHTHEFRHGHCWKCGVPEPKQVQPEPDATSEYQRICPHPKDALSADGKCLQCGKVL